MSSDSCRACRTGEEGPQQIKQAAHKGAAAVLALDWMLTSAGLTLAHAPVLAHASSLALMRPAGRAALALLWVVSLVAVNSGYISRVESLAVAICVVALCTARRLYLALLTMRLYRRMCSW